MLKLKVTRPEDKPLDLDTTVERAVQLFEGELKDKDPGMDQYSVTIRLAIPMDVRRVIEKLYMDAGWLKASVFESIVRPGSTNLSLVRKF